MYLKCLDPIPSHLLQAISPTLLPALTHIINTSLLTGIFPTAFKQARVTPLLRKPTLNTSLLENYRPVSLLPFIAKTLERVVFKQVSLFLSQNNKLDANQSGFRSGFTILSCHVIVRYNLFGLLFSHNLCRRTFVASLALLLSKCL